MKILAVGDRVRVIAEKDYNLDREGVIVERRVWADVPMYTVDFGDMTDPYYSDELRVL